MQIVIAVAVAGSALTMFVVSRKTISDIERAKLLLTPTIVANIDREVDTVLAHFGIEQAWVKKSSISLANSPIMRVERRVAIPRDVLPVQMNVALSAVAKKYSARAIASENVKENSVTIHIELQGFVVQTIILKMNPALKRTEKKNEGVNA